jgi:hypothetical protein
MLRELRVDDAATLFSMLSTHETARFISPPPTTIEGFQRFVEWAIRERERGNYICFAIVPEGMSNAVGLFQVRALEPDFGTAEWGFALGSPYWGSGLFLEGAELVLDFAPPSRMVVAMARCESWARCRKASCAVRSSATANTTIRCCGRSSRKIGLRSRVSRSCSSTELCRLPVSG